MLYTVTISEALKLGREHSRCGADHRKNLEYLGELVEEYATHHWHIQTFEELELTHVLDMIKDMRDNKQQSASYIRHVVNTLRLASNYMHDYHKAPKVEIEERHLPRVLEAPKIWLTYRQIAKACEVARDTSLRKRVDTAKSQPRPMDLGRLIVMTCGLCGLRLTEFGQLTPDCLDAENNLTIMDDTATGKTIKNECSKRVIPLPAIVASAMREYWAKYGQWSRDRTSNGKRVRLLLRATFDATHDDLYTMTPPKNLRKTFVNELDGETDDKYLMAYGGWAFKGTMYRKYQSLRPRPDDPKPIRDRSIAKLRETVVAAIEKKCTDLHF